MRLRHKPWAKDMIKSYPNIIVPVPESMKGRWSSAFEIDQPIHIEVGTGKGKFITEMARAYPQINFIGIELYDSVIVSALQRLVEADLPNVKLLQVNAAKLTEYFAPGEVSRIYLNFSDPWPKNRHEKRRLTYRSFLEIYESILVDQGEIHLKTDNQSFFEYSLISFSQYGLLLKEISLDLHNSNFEGNIMTEYEEKFSKQGNRIYRCVVQYR